MNIAISVNFTGTPDAEDQRAARHIIALENARRAALTPPGTPLPTATGADVKASYLAILTGILTSAHTSYIAQSVSRDGVAERFTADELDQIRKNLVDRLNAGESKAAIIADTAS